MFHRFIQRPWSFGFLVIPLQLPCNQVTSIPNGCPMVQAPHGNAQNKDTWKITTQENMTHVDFVLCPYLLLGLNQIFFTATNLHNKKDLALKWKWLKKINMLSYFCLIQWQNLSTLQRILPEPYQMVTFSANMGHGLMNVDGTLSLSSRKQDFLQLSVVLQGIGWLTDRTPANCQK